MAAIPAPRGAWLVAILYEAHLPVPVVGRQAPAVFAAGR